jgi:hypothetical protein
LLEADKSMKATAAIKTRLKELTDEAMPVIGFIIVIIIGIAYGPWALQKLFPTRRVGYYLEYSVMRRGYWKTAEWSNVEVSAQPHDCEFLTAPIGVKNCHYEPQVRTVQLRTTETGALVASWDGGKTEQVADTMIIPRINVGWEKVAD